MSSPTPNPGDATSQDLNALQAARVEKLRKIEALGLDPWGIESMIVC